MMPKNGWHRADIVAAVHKTGTTLAQLARDHGKHESALRTALSWPRTPSNQIIADYLGRSLHELWPAWFDQAGRLRVGKRADRASGRGAASSQKRAVVSTLTGEPR